MDLTVAWCCGTVIGVVASLGIARRWRSQAKKLILHAAVLVRTAESLRRKATRDFEDARRLRHQAAQLLRESYNKVELDDVAKMRVMRGSANR